MDWMRHVDAVALDMNSDFEEAFLEKCPHIRPVFDYFHLVKNFNDKVVSEVRKDEFKRLMEEGKEEEARMLKRSRYILTANRETLARKDAESAAGKVLRRESKLFATPEKRRTGRYLSRYEELIAKNLFLVKHFSPFSSSCVPIVIMGNSPLSSAGLVRMQVPLLHPAA